MDGRANDKEYWPSLARIPEVGGESRVNSSIVSDRSNHPNVAWETGVTIRKTTIFHADSIC
jgi:hypothetical protein